MGLHATCVVFDRRRSRLELYMPLMDDLLKLNDVDREMRQLQGQLNTATRYFNTQQQKVDELEQRTKELKTRCKQHQASAGNFEIEVQAINDRMDKLREELNSAVTNKQYTALLAELNTIKLQRSEVEDQILKEMNAIEEANSGIAVLNEQATERTTVRDRAKDQLDTRNDQLKSGIDDLKTRRAEAAEGIDPKAISVFDQVADMYEGEAISEVAELNRRHREYACGECNIQVPFEQVSLLLSGSNSLVRCPACFRILSIHEDLRAGLVGKK